MIVSVQVGNVVLDYEAPDTQTPLEVGDLVWLPINSRWSRPALGRVLVLDVEAEDRETWTVKPIVAVVTPEERQVLREHGVRPEPTPGLGRPETGRPPLLGGV